MDEYDVKITFEKRDGRIKLGFDMATEDLGDFVGWAFTPEASENILYTLVQALAGQQQ